MIKFSYIIVYKHRCFGRLYLTKCRPPFGHQAAQLGIYILVKSLILVWILLENMSDNGLLFTNLAFDLNLSPLFISIRTIYSIYLVVNHTNNCVFLYTHVFWSLYLSKALSTDACMYLCGQPYPQIHVSSGCILLYMQVKYVWNTVASARTELSTETSSCINYI